MNELRYEDAERFVKWLLDQVIRDGRGDDLRQMEHAPEGRFWIGRLAPEALVKATLGEARERFNPCAIGIRVRLPQLDGRVVRCRVRMAAWRETDRGYYEKVGPVEVSVSLPTPTEVGEVRSAGREEIASALRSAGAVGLSAEVRAEVEEGRQGPELVLTLVNTSPPSQKGLDTNLYETQLAVEVGKTLPFLLEELPESFRYDRRVDAYGVNCGVVKRGDVLETRDVAVYEQRRLEYWDRAHLGPEPDLSFDRLATDPIPVLRELLDALRRWGQEAWGDEVLSRRAKAERWSDAVVREAREQAKLFWSEVERIAQGLGLLERDDRLYRAFVLMNRAFRRVVNLGHERWRPYQLGFILATLGALTGDRAELDVVDALWFPTGGGKTETYLGLTVLAAFYDRLRGKRHGVTARARFPLRMLSLDQTQRFADVLAAAELVRAEAGIDGDPFSLGCLIGPGTPNRIPLEPGDDDPDYRDPSMPQRYRVLLRCPFCGSKRIEMAFDPSRWTLEHRCAEEDCPWRGPLPFYVVDEEIYRFLPTVVVGTLDKVASIAWQAAMRGLYATPLGRCPVTGHGFTYAPRSDRPTGCLAPGCRERPLPLDQDPSLFPPTLRIQDELHLLRDSLGAIDSHYEGLLDHLQEAAGSQAKLLASSATISGFDRQCEVLYRRCGRLFPTPGPWPDRSFWAVRSQRVARVFCGLAPRGVTIDYAADRCNETLQKAVRRALREPDAVAEEAGVDERLIPELVSLYGVGVVYGCTLKDVEAAARSFETQIDVAPLNHVTLTGRTPFEYVREALDRLKSPEPEFERRIHLVAASSMLSHGVDVDRLNAMVMLGVPLTVAEFVQATARVGRRYPGLVIVLHKIERERDAKVFRSFPQFVAHADRLIDPVPVTRRSRRVLEVTFPGLLMGRVYGVHEPRAVERGIDNLTVVHRLRRAVDVGLITRDGEFDAIVRMLGFHGPLESGVRQDLRAYVDEFFDALEDPSTVAKSPTDLLRTRPMQSLRDVEEQVLVYGSTPGNPEGSR